MILLVDLIIKNMCILILHNEGETMIFHLNHVKISFFCYLYHQDVWVNAESINISLQSKKNSNWYKQNNPYWTVFKWSTGSYKKLYEGGFVHSLKWNEVVDSNIKAIFQAYNHYKWWNKDSSFNKKLQDSPRIWLSFIMLSNKEKISAF